MKKEKLDELSFSLENEIVRVKSIMQNNLIKKDPEDFNIRGELYKIAFKIAPEARIQDIEKMHEWINPRIGEISIDVAAGTGFLTRPVSCWTKERVYAIDPSSVQLENLKKESSDLPIIAIVGSLSEEKTFQKIGEDIGKIDFVTSFGGIHHVLDKDGVDDQKRMFENISAVLKPGGRFVAADVGQNTKLSKHFEISVKKNCLTGHHEKWLNADRLKAELISGTDLRYVKSEIVPIQWVFNSKREMALFMKALHAYDMTEDQILSDLASILGFEEKENKIFLNWPMLFFHLEKN